MLFGRLGILMAADIVNIFIHSWQYFYFQFWLTFMRPTMNKLLPMCLSVWEGVCQCVCVCVCDCVLRFCLNYGNMPKICFSLWGACPAISSRLPFRFAFCWFMAFIGQVLCLFVVHCFGQFFVCSCCCRLGYELLISSAPWSDCCAIYKIHTHIYVYILYMSAIYIVVYANFLLLSFRLCSTTVPHLFNGIFIS